MAVESSVVTPVPADPPEALSMVDIQALKLGLEEAIQLCLRGEASAVVILAPRPIGAKAWQGGPDGMSAAGRCQMALVKRYV